jgi:hypothetical protein
VGKPLTLGVSFKNMNEFMVEKNLLCVIKVENPLVTTGTSKCIKEFTLERNLMYESNVGKFSFFLVPQ